MCLWKLLLLFFWLPHDVVVGQGTSMCETTIAVSGMLCHSEYATLFALQPALVNGKCQYSGSQSGVHLYWSPRHDGIWVLDHDTGDSAYTAYVSSTSALPPVGGSAGVWKEHCDDAWQLVPALQLGAGSAVGAAGDSCRYARDGECDEPQYCAVGTDSSDCGAPGVQCPAHAHASGGQCACDDTFCLNSAGASCEPCACPYSNDGEVHLLERFRSHSTLPLPHLPSHGMHLICSRLIANCGCSQCDDGSTGGQRYCAVGTDSADCGAASAPHCPTHAHTSAGQCQCDDTFCLNSAGTGCDACDCPYIDDGVCDEGLYCAAGSDAGDCAGTSCSRHSDCIPGFYCRHCSEAESSSSFCAGTPTVCDHCGAVTTDHCQAIGCADHSCVDPCCDDVELLMQCQSAVFSGGDQRCSATSDHCVALGRAALALPSCSEPTSGESPALDPCAPADAGSVGHADTPVCPPLCAEAWMLATARCAGRAGVAALASTAPRAFPAACAAVANMALLGAPASLTVGGRL